MDGDFAIHRSLVQAVLPRIRFLFIGSWLCSTLPSVPASRRRPCASLALHLHQVVQGTCTPKLSNMLGTRWPGRLVVPVAQRQEAVGEVWPDAPAGAKGRPLAASPPGQRSCPGHPRPSLRRVAGVCLQTPGTWPMPCRSRGFPGETPATQIRSARRGMRLRRATNGLPDHDCQGRLEGVGLQVHGVA